MAEEELEEQGEVESFPLTPSLGDMFGYGEGKSEDDYLFWSHRNIGDTTRKLIERYPQITQLPGFQKLRDWYQWKVDYDERNRKRGE